MNFANMNLAYQRYPIDYFLDSTVQLDLQAIELWGGEPHLHVEKVTASEVQSLFKKIKSRNLEIICFTPEQCSYPVNLAAPDNETRKSSIRYFEKSLAITDSLECPYLLISAGYGFFNEPEENAWKRARDSIYQIAQLAEKKGITLLLEPFFYPYSNVVINARTAKRMLAEIKNPFLKVMIDIPCMIVAGDTIEDYNTLFADDLVHIHFVDGQWNNSSHLALGKGEFPLGSLKESLENIGYNGYLTLEVFGNQYNADPEKCVQASLDYARKKWGSVN